MRKKTGWHQEKEQVLHGVQQVARVLQYRRLVFVSRPLFKGLGAVFTAPRCFYWVLVMCCCHTGSKIPINLEKQTEIFNTYPATRKPSPIVALHTCEKMSAKRFGNRLFAMSQRALILDSDNSDTKCSFCCLCLCCFTHMSGHFYQKALNAGLKMQFW